MAKTGKFPKQLFVTIEGERGKTWLSASTTVEEAFNTSQINDNPKTVAVYELNNVGKVVQTTDWKE